MLKTNEFLALKVAGFSILEEGEAYCHVSNGRKRWIIIRFPIDAPKPIQLYYMKDETYGIGKAVSTIEEAITIMKTL